MQTGWRLALGKNTPGFLKNLNTLPLVAAPQAHRACYNPAMSLAHTIYIL